MFYLPYVTSGKETKNKLRTWLSREGGMIFVEKRKKKIQTFSFQFDEPFLLSTIYQKGDSLMVGEKKVHDSNHKISVEELRRIPKDKLLALLFDSGKGTSKSLQRLIEIGHRQYFA
ncbi:hypothetical protein KAR28_06960 [Candidatus Parcubacteria bacterium]|nr:hypothetical protein [Candidatus Parcubacteria bacterium]